MKKRFFVAAVLLAFLLSAGITVVRAARDAKPIRESVVRLHIMADSDEKAAQKVKIEVRNAIIDGTKELFCEIEDAASARNIIAQRLPLFERIANEKLQMLSARYTARASLEPHYFPTRSYGAVSLPAGEYDSLVIRLGSGEGKNWWCVMFPPLCYDGEEVAVEGESLRILEGELKGGQYDILTGKTVVKFKVLELLGELFH